MDPNPIQITITSGVAGAATWFLKDFLRRRRPQTEEPPTLEALHGAVAALRGIVAELRVIVSSLPGVQGDIAILQQQQRQTEVDLRRHDHDITDVRREAAGLDDRVRKLERRQ